MVDLRFCLVLLWRLGLGGGIVGVLSLWFGVIPGLVQFHRQLLGIIGQLEVDLGGSGRSKGLGVGVGVVLGGSALSGLSRCGLSISAGLRLDLELIVGLQGLLRFNLFGCEANDLVIPQPVPIVGP